MPLSQKEIKRNSLQRRKDNNLCINCGKPMDRVGSYCNSCLEKRRIEAKKDREYYIQNHVCPRCRKETLYGEETICSECAGKEYKNSMRSRKRLGRDHYNEVHREWAKRIYKQDVENGLCYRCRKRPADHGYKSCGICRKKTADYKRIVYREKVKIPREERVKMGICYFCDSPVKDGYKVCDKHWRMNLEKSKKQVTKPWRTKNAI